MPRTKGSKNLKVEIETKEKKQPVIVSKELVVRLLCDKIPSLFDRFPQGSLSRDGVSKLVDEILNLLK